VGIDKKRGGEVSVQTTLVANVSILNQICRFVLKLTR